MAMDLHQPLKIAETQLYPENGSIKVKQLLCRGLRLFLPHDCLSPVNPALNVKSLRQNKADKRMQRKDVKQKVISPEEVRRLIASANCLRDRALFEQRSDEEVKGAYGAFGAVQWSPTEISVYNPAFDVTPHSLITGFILDTGYLSALPSAGLSN